MNDRDEMLQRRTVLGNPADPTRAEPEPWFVGSGRGLMIAVISICGLLLAVRAVSALWLAEAAWDWWARPETRRSGDSRPPVTLPVSLRVSSVANPADWITADDYPLESIRREEGGRVAISWDVGRDGRVRRCRVVTSSGYPRLDSASCGAIRRNGWYPLIANGKQRPRSFSRRVIWRLPD